MDLIEGMDKAPELKTKVYRLKSITPERVDKLVRALLGASLAKRAYQGAIDHDSESLAVSATPEVHAHRRIVKGTGRAGSRRAKPDPFLQVEEHQSRRRPGDHWRVARPG